LTFSQGSTTHFLTTGIVMQLWYCDVVARSRTWRQTKALAGTASRPIVCCPAPCSPPAPLASHFHTMGDVQPTDHELDSLSAACARLWDLDENRLTPGED